MLAGLMTVAGELLLLAVALGCQSWRGLLGAGAAPLTLFLSYGYGSLQSFNISEAFCIFPSRLQEPEPFDSVSVLMSADLMKSLSDCIDPRPHITLSLLAGVRSH